MLNSWLLAKMCYISLFFMSVFQINDQYFTPSVFNWPSFSSGNQELIIGHDKENNITTDMW